MGYVVEDLLASQIFNVLADASSLTSDSYGSMSASNDLGLFHVLREVINLRSLLPLSRAFSGVIIYPKGQAASSRIAGEITALQAVRLLHLLQSSIRDDDYKEALEQCVRTVQRSVVGSRVADACVDQILIILCMQAHALIGEGRSDAALHAISGHRVYHAVHLALRCCIVNCAHCASRNSYLFEDAASRWMASNRFPNGDLAWASGHCFMTCSIFRTLTCAHQWP